jgi:Double zinc ribbon
MNAKSVRCPGCGRPATGRYCSHCGTAVACPSCGTKIEPDARACHACGALLTLAPRQSTAQIIVPWIAIGIATMALVVAGVSFVERGNRAQAPMAFSSPQPTNMPASSVDLSSMTPRQAADRLYNRIMTASERGDTEEAMRFVPMALSAYELLGTLDNDARYHVALIHLTAGDIQGARTQIDSIRQSVPDHLLAIMVERDIAERSGDQNGVAKAYKKFLAAYDEEIAAERPEYQDHWSAIERFRKAAQASVAEKK